MVHNFPYSYKIKNAAAEGVLWRFVTNDLIAVCLRMLNEK